jgi:hypothetical protein
VNPVYLKLPCKLTSYELMEAGKKLSQSVSEVHGIQNAKKLAASEFKAKEERAQGEVSEIARTIATETEMREVVCCLHYHYDEDTVITIREDTGETVDARRMKEHERQA